LLGENAGWLSRGGADSPGIDLNAGYRLQHPL